MLHNAMGDVNFPEEKNIMKVYQFYIICVMRGGGGGWEDVKFPGKSIKFESPQGIGACL